MLCERKSISFHFIWFDKSIRIRSSTQMRIKVLYAAFVSLVWLWRWTFKKNWMKENDALQSKMPNKRKLNSSFTQTLTHTSEFSAKCIQSKQKKKKMCAHTQQHGKQFRSFIPFILRWITLVAIHCHCVSALCTISPYWLWHLLWKFN